MNAQAKAWAYVRECRSDGNADRKGGVQPRAEAHVECPRSTGRVDALFAALLEREDVVAVGVSAFHARRAHRHAGDGDAGNRWLFLQQLLYDVGGHVAFDDVAGDERRVA